MRSPAYMMAAVMLCSTAGYVAGADSVWAGQYERITAEERQAQKLITEKLYSVYGGGKDKGRSGRTFGRNSASKKYPHVPGSILYTKDTVYKVARVAGHTAIAVSGRKIIEATDSGVKKTANDWERKEHCIIGVVKGLSDRQKGRVTKKCSSWIGRPYNWNFINVHTRKRFYCSQLVWAGYKDVAKVDLNRGSRIVLPSELVAHRKVKIIYRKGG